VILEFDFDVEAPAAGASEIGKRSSIFYCRRPAGAFGAEGPVADATDATGSTDAAGAAGATRRERRERRGRCGRQELRPYSASTATTSWPSGKMLYIMIRSTSGAARWISMRQPQSGPGGAA
jgi:hypothetical protein